ncbi:MAG: hypothetical protein ACXWVT_06715 [Burkholderiaceae bacterium]
MRRILVATTAALAVFASTLFAPLASALVISFTNVGTVLPSAGCPPPPALPLDCLITATGTVTDVDGIYGPWQFQSDFTTLSAGQPSPTQFLVTGTFVWDDPSAANNDIAGTVAGIFDLSTFSTTFDYTITGGTGAFAGATGHGNSLVLVNLLNGTYTETGRLVIPEPATLALLLCALLPVIPAFVRRSRASRPRA